jgi:hypothetical protein
LQGSDLRRREALKKQFGELFLALKSEWFAARMHDA